MPSHRTQVWYFLLKQWGEKSYREVANLKEKKFVSLFFFFCQQQDKLFI
jgi:hypothetical protein